MNVKVDPVSRPSSVDLMNVGATTITAADLPDGVERLTLMPHADERGCLTEVFRSRWTPAMTPVQWNLVRSQPNVLRGVHCHIDHSDYLVLIDGSMLLGLHDLRPDSPTAGCSALFSVRAAEEGIVIPPGVAHGFWFSAPSLLIYGVTHEWDVADELGCRYDDEGLGLAWPCSTPELSPRDVVAGDLNSLRAVVRERLAAPATS